MNIHEFNREFYNLSSLRKKEFMHKLVDTLLDNAEEETIDDAVSLIVLGDFLDACELEEEHDYFGTEGFDKRFA